MAFVFALLHGVFVFVVGTAGNRTALNVAAVLAAIVAVVVGDSSYALGDLLAVGAAYFLAADIFIEAPKRASDRGKQALAFDGRALVEPVVVPTAGEIAPSEDEAPSISQTPAPERAYPGFVIRRNDRGFFWVYYDANRLAISRSEGEFTLLRDCVRSVDLMKWCTRSPVHEADWNTNAPELLRPLTES